MAANGRETLREICDDIEVDTNLWIPDFCDHNEIIDWDTPVYLLNLTQTDTINLRKRGEQEGIQQA